MSEARSISQEELDRAFLNGAAAADGAIIGALKNSLDPLDFENAARAKGQPGFQSWEKLPDYAREHWRSVAETARAVIVAEYSELHTAAMAVANSPYDSAERRDAIIRLRAAVHAGDAHERT